ncbi:FtsX-like permease family protein [Anaeromyxobacter diazotrophicus]|uniref:ABC3 transporter permease C-terminal domain-containing protein n=1 Tax=Anaeromyxobacter diazotrophicus TaxID=2590199 RepID=A0A7I9VQP9_9BACT|nr:FtsX-like permease family protein [Anaeromyxobacter diazotrophicus]GEJ58742.1 hypothetical protein AMYX_34830 [Anaeromyxobacter diazotrophicus]
MTASPRPSPEPPEAPPAPAARPPVRLARAFSAPTFGLAAAGVLLAPLVAAVADVALSDRLGLATGLAAGLAILAGAVVAVGFGLAAAAAGRRIGFYEIGAAVLVLLALFFGPVLLAVPRLRATGLVLSAWEAQGTLVVVLGLLLSALLSGAATFVGASLGFLLFGSGRLDASMSYELFVAKSHLRLSPRTLLAGFLLVVTGVVPGLLVLLVRAARRAARERRAARSGELVWRPRMPATLLMTLISIGGVAIGVWALTVVLSVMSGFEADLKGKILGTRSHGMLTKYGNGDFTEWRQVREQVLAVTGVTGATPFIYSEVMVSAGQNLSGTLLEGIDPRTVGTVLELPRTVDDGKLDWLLHPEQIPPAPEYRSNPEAFFKDAPPGKEPKAPPPKAAPPEAPQGAGPAARPLPGIVLGRELARGLRVYVGDVVNVISPLGDLGPSGPQPKSRPFKVAAIFYSGMYEYDSKFAYVDLAEAQRFFGLGDSVHGFELKVRDVDEARPILRRVLAALEGYPYRVRDWGELNRNLFSALMMEKVVMAVILGFIVLVATFTIVATLIMQVLDKRREIAVLKSMGAGRPSVMKVFVAEGLVIGAVGTGFGLLLGLGTCLLIDKVGIPLDPEVYYISNLPVRMNPVEFLLVALLALALSYLATIYPASKASRLEPVEGLRAE